MESISLKFSAITDRGVESISTKLQGIRVGFGICGGIGSVETIKIIRELRRHGADVWVFHTPSAVQFITPRSLQWACGKPVIGQADGDVSYLEAFDAVVVAPTTMNTLQKAASAITDSVVLLLVASQIGRGKPVFLFPTMNQALLAHPGNQDAVAKLEGWGVRVVSGEPEEGRLKMPSPESVTKQLIQVVSSS